MRSSKCIIHGNNTLKMIGTTKPHNGLYLLTFPTNPNNHAIMTSYITNNNNNPTTCNHTIHNWNLWLSHVYHISNENLTHINKDYHLHLTSKYIYVCDTCFYAKLKRLPSHNSVSSSLGYFDLIHMDI